MNILRAFQQRSPFFFFFLFVLGGVNSLLYSGILLFINDALAGHKQLGVLKQYDWQLFLLLITVSVVTTRVFHAYLIGLTNGILLDFELSVLNKLRLANFQAFEKLGSQKVHTAINDTKVLAQVPEYLVALLNAVVIVVCGLGYLFWISPLGGGSVVLVMLGLLVFYLVRTRSIEKDLNRLRDMQNDFYRYLNDLLQGFKELKMSISRNDRIYQHHLKENRLTSRALTRSTSIRFLNNELTGSYSWYLVLGVVLFLLPRVAGMSDEQVTSFVLAILYLIGPVATLITVFPFYIRSKIAAQRIRTFEEEVHANTGGDNAYGDLTGFGEGFSELRFEGVTFEYPPSATRDTFGVGPLDVTIEPGETVFVIGGNGSGKSTFVNLLTGLYKPAAGEIWLNGIRVTPDKYASYSNQISAIFTNNFLFEENYDDFDLSPGNHALGRYLSLMELDQVVRVDDNQRIGRNLSKGQQKRLAMIYALMENRQLLVLDEWAAEQDPYFREYFYCEFLQMLKAMGKTVVAITHDDRYYGKADRLLKFEYGRITELTGVVA
jgi:cyclic peptide transporter